jgi:hypothetical protein
MMCIEENEVYRTEFSVKMNKKISNDKKSSRRKKIEMKKS